MSCLIFSLDKSHPRSVFLLNGTWRIEPGSRDVPPTEFNRTIPVPSLVDCADPQYDWHSAEYHWYRTSFRVEGKKKHTFLKFDQSQYGTEVWLNGRRVGGSISCYTSHEYRIEDALRENEENVLLVRVGAKSTLPPESAVGKDQEKQTFIPGIWGDVSLIVSGDPRVARMQVIPHVASSTAEVRVTVENLDALPRPVGVRVQVREKDTTRPVSGQLHLKGGIPPAGEVAFEFFIPIAAMRLWAPQHPFLYEVTASVTVDEETVDESVVSFGMREFTIRGSDFFLNGERAFLRGGNIAFHRFLSDPERGLLPWTPEWVKRALIDIPKEHNFNFFRVHLGQMYNLWYDIADRHGMLLQNEWQFWGVTGTKEQIRREFTQWLRDNWNHPSIIIWDSLNESTSDIVQHELVPEMKKLDPSRAWESVDFVEQHPYIYSLGPVLNKRRLGFTLPLDEIENLKTPSVVNEFLWWWLDGDGKPTKPTEEVIERWLGREWTKEDLLQHQAFLAQELVELFRRLRVDAIQPIAYLSNGNGPTANWFLRPIAELRPKPVIDVLRNSFAPFGVSIELWDRHFFAGEKRRFDLYVFNDHAAFRGGTVRYGVVDSDGMWLSSLTEHVRVDGSRFEKKRCEVRLPAEAGTYHIVAELYGGDGSSRPVISRKVAHVFSEPAVPQELLESRLVLLDGRGELSRFLLDMHIPFSVFTGLRLHDQQLLVVAEGMVREAEYHDRIFEISSFVRGGGRVLLIEPEFGLEGKETIPVLSGLDIEIAKREDADKGGYDSFAFAEEYSHPLWKSISKEHLKMFNGAFGGEVVSQHDVTPLAEHTVLARCGLRLGVIAVAEMSYGSGKMFLSRLQTRGRLVRAESSESLYGRRVDPVSQQYFLNLLAHASRPTP